MYCTQCVSQTMYPARNRILVLQTTQSVAIRTAWDMTCHLAFGRNSWQGITPKSQVALQAKWHREHVSWIANSSRVMSRSFKSHHLQLVPYPEMPRATSQRKSKGTNHSMWVETLHLHM